MRVNPGILVCLAGLVALGGISALFIISNWDLVGPFLALNGEEVANRLGANSPGDRSILVILPYVWYMFSFIGFLLWIISDWAEKK